MGCAEKREAGSFLGRVPPPSPGPRTGRTAIVSVKAGDPAVLFNFTPSSSSSTAHQKSRPLPPPERALSRGAGPWRKAATESGWRTLLEYTGVHGTNHEPSRAGRQEFCLVFKTRGARAYSVAPTRTKRIFSRRGRRRCLLLTHGVNALSAGNWKANGLPRAPSRRIAADGGARANVV
jgi:hypothetical protein